MTKHFFTFRDKLSTLETLNCVEKFFTSPRFPLGTIPRGNDVQSKTIQKISFTETIEVSSNRQYIYDGIRLAEIIKLNRTKVNFTYKEQLVLNQHFYTDKGYFYVNDHLTFTQQVHPVINDQFNNKLTFTENIYFLVQKRTLQTIHDTLTFTEGIDYLLKHNKKLVHPPNFDVPCNTFIETLPYCVFTSDSATLTLTAPNKGNSDNLDLGRLNKRTRGGELILFRAPHWPQQDILKLDIPMYNCEGVINARYFFDNCLGKLIHYTDQENYIYPGIVTNYFEIETQRDISFLFHVEFTVLFGAENP